MAYLLLLTGARQGQRLQLQKNKIVLGREPTCDVVINETMFRCDTAGRTESVSRKHATISCVGGTYHIEDGDGQGNPSRNGTYVNEKKLAFPGRRLLRNNDRVRICDFGCTYHEDEDTPSSVEASIGHDSSISSLQSQSAEKLRVLLEISNSLSTTLDMEAIRSRIIDNLFQLFKQADRAFIILRDQASDSLTVQALKTRRPADEPDARFSNSIVRGCLDKVQAILGNDLPEQFPDSESLSVLPMRSLMCAPLWSQDGKAVGAIQLDTQDLGKKFTEEDLKLLLGVASQASIALSNARLHRDSLVHQSRERDLEVASHVQQALLPQKLPEVPDYQFYAYYESAQQIGGDYYDFIPLPGQRLAILLGDVAGKGVAAALVMAKFSVEARVCLESEPDLAAAVTKLNAFMVRAAMPDRFVTLIAVVLDPATHSATLVNAGHPSPLLCRQATGQVEEATSVRVAGPPVGIIPGYDYPGCAVQLLPGDGLLLFSDGVTDALDAQERPFRVKGIHAVLQAWKFSPQVTGERLIQSVKRHASGCSQNDDITLVCFGRVGN